MIGKLSRTRVISGMAKFDASRNCVCEGQH
jgi:hypothetical protein